MKSFIFLTLFCFLISINLIGSTGALFQYDSESLNNEFSDLIRIENLIASNNNSFEELLVNDESLSNLIALQDDNCNKGKADAKIRYKGSGPFWGSLCITGGTNPLFGLIFVFSSVNKIQDKNLNLDITNSSIMNNTEYINCYRTSALEIKKKKLWTGFGIGTGIYAVAIVYLIVSYSTTSVY